MARAMYLFTGRYPHLRAGTGTHRCAGPLVWSSFSEQGTTRRALFALH